MTFSTKTVALSAVLLFVSAPLAFAQEGGAMMKKNDGGAMMKKSGSTKSGGMMMKKSAPATGSGESKSTATGGESGGKPSKN